MNQIKYRLLRAFWGTVAVTLGLILVVIPVPFLMQLSPAMSLTGLVVKMLVGVLVLAKGLEQYELASFPPGAEALQDPVANWLQTQLAFLKKRAWPLWFVAILVLMFSPILMTVFLPLVLLRPFYATFTGTGPYPEVLVRELKQTAIYLLEMGKGLLVLTLCSCMALAVSLVTLAVALYQLHQGP